jgi:hypothetical protein
VGLVAVKQALIGAGVVCAAGTGMLGGSAAAAPGPSPGRAGNARAARPQRHGPAVTAFQSRQDGGEVVRAASGPDALAEDALIDNGDEQAWSERVVMCRLAPACGVRPATTAKLSTRPRTSSAIHPSRVGPHASIRRSAACGTARCPRPAALCGPLTSSVLPIGATLLAGPAARSRGLGQRGPGESGRRGGRALPPRLGRGGSGREGCGRSRWFRGCLPRSRCRPSP